MPDPQARRDSIADPADSAPPAFACSCSNGGLDAAWVHVAGELDIATTPQLDRTLRESQLEARLVVLDLRELSFMDSSGVHAIVDASIRARHDVRRLVLLRAPPDLDRIFTLTGSCDQVEIGDVDPVAPRGEILLHLAGTDRAA